MNRKSYRDAVIHCRWAKSQGIDSLDVIKSVLGHDPGLAGWNFARKVVARKSMEMRNEGN